MAVNTDPTDKVCPTCGRCPTCGHHVPVLTAPWWYYQRPYYPPHHWVNDWPPGHVVTCNVRTDNKTVAK